MSLFRPRIEALEDRCLPSNAVQVAEIEPPGGAINNTFATAQHLSGFGTGPREYAAADISGSLGSPFRMIDARENDGAIRLANATGLIAGGADTILVNATIGDGPHGGHGTGAADYDHYLVPSRAGQLITVEVEAYDLGSTLDSVVGIYDGAGHLLASNDNKSNDYYNGYGQLNLDSRLRFLVPADDTYSVVVLGAGSDFQTNPFDASSGGGAASEGPYQLMIALKTPLVMDSAEDDGAIQLATPTGLVGGASGIAYAAGTIGDGPHGSSGTATGDFDFYRVDALPGQLIEVDVDTPDPSAGLDSFVAIFNSAGEVFGYQDDDGKTFDPRLVLPVVFADTYYVAVGGARDIFSSRNLPGDPFDPASGFGAASEGAYTLTIEVRPNDVDYYSFDLEAGDIVGINLGGFGAQRTALIDAASGDVLVASQMDSSVLYPDESPLPGGGDASWAYVVTMPGRYRLTVSRGVGPYLAELRVFRPVLEQQPAFTHQVLFLDFDGATIDPSIFERTGPPDSRLSPLSAFLPRWGLGAADEDAVIDAIIATVAENLAEDVSGVLGRGLNGDFVITGRAGEFQIEILNSRDHADPFGLYPNVSRVIVGGSNLEAFGPDTEEWVLGVAESVDVGNFDTSETGLALLDFLSDPESFFSLNVLPRGPGVSIIELIGPAVGNLVSHEAGHFFGNLHTFSWDGHDLMGLAPLLPDAGADGFYGTADDPDVDFGQEFYLFGEAVEFGMEDTLNVIAFGLSTGTQAGTYFDFVTGTLYVSGNLDDSHKDRLEARARNGNLEVFINGDLADTRPLTSVERIYFNGSGDADVMDASGLDLPVTMMGRGGDDKLTGGRGDDHLDGGSGDDALDGGRGNDILVGGDGDDKLESGEGSDLLIGGRGSDKLDGGDGGDLLIAGFTAFDANSTALNSILAEWTSGRDYHARMANLRGNGSGPRLNADYFLKAQGSEVTVFDDGDDDQLTGGLGRDWFFASQDHKKDKITDARIDEFVDEL